MSNTRPCKACGAETEDICLFCEKPVCLEDAIQNKDGCLICMKCAKGGK